MSDAIVPNNSIRVKVMSACNLRCGFCHNEGSHTMFKAMAESEFREIVTFAAKYGFKEVHFTGGEPTLHRLLPRLVRQATDAGIETGMTSNGNYRDELTTQLIHAGLTSINYSFHGMNASTWAQVQCNTSIDQAERQLSLALVRIREAHDLGLSAKVNVVVANGATSAIEVVDKMTELGVAVRLLDVLGSASSRRDIDQILHHYSARLERVVITAGTSQVKDIYSTEVGVLVVKRIRDWQIPSICTATAGCHEQFYGIRMEARNGIVYSRLCLCSETETTLMPLAAFESSQQFRDIVRVADQELQG